MNKITENFYKVLFPLALIMACVGLAVFIPNLFSDEIIYPVNFHRKMMLEVFMCLALGGFLFTALPQFTKTEFISFNEVVFVVANLVLASLFLTIGYSLIFHALMFSFMVYLMFFIVSRLVSAKEGAPFSFYYLPVAVFWGISAELLWLINELIPTQFLDSTARYLLYNGFILGTIAGVGIRLIPALLGHVEVVKNQKSLYEKNLPTPNSFWFTLIIFNIFIVVYLFFNEFLAELLKIFWIALISLTYWKIHKLPKTKTIHSFGVWISIWSILIGVISSAILSDQFVHWTHLTFISGFLLLIVMVMTRVTIAHNKLGSEKETSKWLGVVIGLIVFAALTRASAYLIPDSYTNHLAYASLIMLIAFAILSSLLNHLRK